MDEELDDETRAELVTSMLVRLEPGLTKDIHQDGLLASIAISLKRIADQMEKDARALPYDAPILSPRTRVLPVPDADDG